MKKSGSFILVSLLLSGMILLTSSGNNQNDDGKDLSGHKFRYVKNEAFGVGEKFEYDIGYKFITAGTGYIEVKPQTVTRYGRKSYDVRFVAKSLESLEWIYKVRDSYRSVIDVGGIFPWEFEQHIRENKYKRDSYAYFDQLNHNARVGDKTFNTVPYVHDIISAFMYVRTLDLKNFPKDTLFYLNNFFDDSTFTLGIKVHGKQTIEVDAGKFRCVVIEPLVVKGGLFQSDGNIFIWLSDDDRKIPVKLATKIVIGFVGAELTKYSGLRGSLDAKLE